MYGARKEEWDLTGELSEKRARSLKHLATLATSVVTELLGPSSEKSLADQEEAQYQLDLQHWEQDQISLRSMSDEEFERAIRGGMTRPRPQRKESAFAPQTSEELDSWLRKKITDRLIKKVDSVLDDLIGIETTYSGTRLKSASSGSFFGAKLVERAKTIANALVDKWLVEHETDEVKEIKVHDLARIYQQEVEKATRVALVARIQAVAKQRADHIQIEVLEAAVDKAMFDNYPILRRMDATERLGGKSET